MPVFIDRQDNPPVRDQEVHMARWHRRALFILDPARRGYRRDLELGCAQRGLDLAEDIRIRVVIA